MLGALTREFCAENMELVPAAVAAGAARIELCDNLAVGGTTPSYGVIRAAVAFARDHGVDVMCMVRPRGGSFEHTPEEAAMMRDDLALAKRLGVTGVVFGCLRDGRLDRALTAELVRLAHEDSPDAPGRVDVTFHMAFDALAPADQLEAIDWLADQGVERILTHGGAAGTPIADNLERLRAYVERAAGRIIILPGGGITWENAESVASALGVGEVHGTKIVRVA
ncbi:copper homeostasis protein CutC [Olsenella sp. An293]|uniref:copper homeostasis protein CutC n=1 Tax=Olsenella sp. An293 TaxID=1965626 RepID=UPI002100E214|nr:copper homeostasis protein CutC [Olsenella sp. An293]